ncbi:MAG: purine-cytosine permease family protein, partial [Steroidobacteraceae bacterium]
MGTRTRIETRSIDYVPLAERHGKVWHLWPVWFSGDAHLATLAVGVLGITLGGNLLWTAVAVLLGCVLGTFFMAFHSTQGPQLGLPQMIQSRPQFGYIGALLVWAVALTAYIGYNAFNQVLAAQALHQLTPAISPTSPTVIVVFALIALSLAAVGYDQIHLAQRGFAYLMIAILAVFSSGALLLLRFPAAQWDPRGFRAVPFLAQLFAAASYQLSWSIYVSDYSRYLPRDVGVRESFWWTYVGAFVGGAWMMLAGTVAAAVAPKLEV